MGGWRLADTGCSVQISSYDGGPSLYSSSLSSILIFILLNYLKLVYLSCDSLGCYNVKLVCGISFAAVKIVIQKLKNYKLESQTYSEKMLISHETTRENKICNFYLQKIHICNSPFFFSFRFSIFSISIRSIFLGL